MNHKINAFAVITVSLSIFFIVNLAMAAGYGDPAYGGKPYNKPSQQIQQQQQQKQQPQQQKNEEKQDADQYLKKIATGSRLVATKCPDGEGKYYATGTRPKIKPEVVSCIDLQFRAYCPGNTQYSDGIAKNFIGMSGCFGDTYDINPKPPCKVDQVRIEIVEARSCGGF
jgi:transcription initiation factor TFIID subunit TAF12